MIFYMEKIKIVRDRVYCYLLQQILNLILSIIYLTLKLYLLKVIINLYFKSVEDSIVVKINYLLPDR
uniref:hypothetical protein n=1 Tax=Laurencia obtusa TaxID=137763 RepID=UPI0028D34825|nr:hypothetical protein RU989_pgp216 [Laurencia obtusa]WMP12795.1 hypothetical protein [Laurencia obtusa]